MMCCIIWLSFLLSVDTGVDTVYFQSTTIADLELTPLDVTRTILDDQLDSISVEGYIDRNGVLYWHRKLHTPVCQTGECKEIDVGIYWKCSGDFMGLEVYREHLTRTDHSIFSPQDYALLMKTLGNDWSILREYEYDDLLTEPMDDTEGSIGVEAVTGATRKEISEETVADAVYTTYTLWHLIHVGEKEQLRSITAEMLNRDRQLLSRLIHSTDQQYANFVLELFGEGKLVQTNEILSQIKSNLHPDRSNIQRELALKSLTKLDLTDAGVQDELASIYHTVRPNEQIRILNYMDNPERLSPALYKALTENLTTSDEWLVGRTLQVVKVFQSQDPSVIKLAEKLTESRNGFVRQSATEFLVSVRKNGNF